MIHQTGIWASLQSHHQATKSWHMRDLFAQNPHRFDQMHEVLAEDFLVDYSKNRITEETLDLLLHLAEQAQLREHINAMFRGDKINLSENRPALHIASRLPKTAQLSVEGEDVVPQVHQSLEKALNFAEQVRSGSLKGFTGKPFTDIVNIGIGGSDLGAKALSLALKPFSGSLNIHFVSNVDPAYLSETLQRLSPETTLFIISSKSFTTAEVFINAQLARQWFLNRQPEKAIAHHFVAVSNNLKQASDFGIKEAFIFSMAEWVGGRFSVTSTIGLLLMLAIGENHFRAFLSGAHEMDRHFHDAPFRHNVPVLLALIDIWYLNFYHAYTRCIVPYHHGLHLFPAHLQQLMMESNGKSVSLSGQMLDIPTSPVIFGTEGTDAQHSYFQLLHQGSHLIPADFIVVVRDEYRQPESQKVLFSNALAQTQVLMSGHEDSSNEKFMQGNRPSNTIAIPRLTPFHCGMLLALYEHRTFVQSVIWGINAFDQWGVQYGKIAAQKIQSQLDTQEEVNHDASTNALIQFFRKHRND
ncbi:MAG: glucose-6-phosphate isomerase [Neisseriaceae bacterium]|nr:glucose-6-phosphate isomerase [Neisseriaceae bacterium]